METKKEDEQHKPTGGEDEDYFDQVAEAEAGKIPKLLPHRNIDNPTFNPAARAAVAKRKTSYNLGEGAYDPIRSDSEAEDFSVDELSEPETPEGLTSSRSKVKNKRSVRMEPMGTASEGTSIQDDGLESTAKKSIAGRRKRGISPLKLRKSSLAMANGRGSSPTPSASSIKIMIRDKLSSVSKSIPTVLMKRKADEYKLQAFVAILFLVIILLVGSIYVIHQEKELQKAYFNKIRFSSNNRKILVANLKNRQVLTGILGTSLTDKDKAWPCLKPDLRGDDTTCMEWMDKARLYFSLLPSSPSPSIQCYGIFWQSLSPSFSPKDCFHMGEKKGFYFYGGGEMRQNHWPLNRTTVPFSPFLTGEGGRWGRTIRPYFVSSPGAGILVSEDTPLHISINDELNPEMICFGAKSNDFAFPTVRVPVTLNYTVCTGESVKDVFVQLADRRMSVGHLQEDVHRAYALAKAPIWQILPQTVDRGNHSEDSLLNHTDVIANLHLSEGIILLDETWQRRLGDLEMDKERFPGIQETFNITRRRGFKVALTIQPYFSTQSTSYSSGLAKGLWIRERGGQSEIPALTSYKSAETAVVLDMTQKESRDWLEDRLNTLVKASGLDAVFLDFGSAHNFPRHYEFGTPLHSPDEYKRLFTKAIRKVGGGIYTIGVSGTRKAPKLPAFAALSPLESSWEGLQSIIPNFLTMGVSGFPFIMPGSIGGDFKIKNSLDFEANKPERNLYIRWLELTHFLPVIHYSYLPSDYDGAVVDIARNLNVIRTNKVYGAIRKAIEEALVNGLPIIRPLWMTDPNEPACLKRWDEFTIGGDILVAPILTYNTTERNIYLPKGRWKDELDGTSTKGDKWLNNYRVPENKIAFFTKLADG